MQATALSLSLVGLDAHLVQIEVDSGRGPTCFHLVGLAEASVREARVRVKAALQQIDVDMDQYVLTVNLSPADLRKVGGGFDLAIACAILGALGRLPDDALEGVVLLGELALSGHIRPVRGVLPALFAARQRGITRAIVPEANAAEASCAHGLDVRVASQLVDVVAHLRKKAPLPAPTPAKTPRQSTCFGFDLAEVRGQHGARRALEIAAAGGHNLLMMGPPGAGKTMLARRLPTILPQMTPEEALVTTAIHSVAGTLPMGVGLLEERPFRAPHHTISVPGLVGGGSPVRAGEVSLAHHGCLFLDELLEFGRAAVEALRQPLEDGVVTVCRVRERATFPARPLLVGAVNPCPCGHAGSPRCTCGPERVRAYRSRLSGPLLDRLDLQLTLSPVDIGDLASRKPGEASVSVRERVGKARAMQRARFEAGETSTPLNAELPQRDLERVAPPDAAGEALLKSAAETLNLSARGWGKVLRVGRTIADLEGATGICAAHIAEALHLRLLDGRGRPPLAELRT